MRWATCLVRRGAHLKLSGKCLVLHKLRLVLTHLEVAGGVIPDVRVEDRLHEAARRNRRAVLWARVGWVPRVCWPALGVHAGELRVEEEDVRDEDARRN